MTAKRRTCASALVAVVAVSLFPAGSLHAADAQAMPQPLSTRKIEVIGGRVVGAAESPWQVALVSSAAINHVDGVFCGGTMIDSQWVLTAAHCLYDPANCAKLAPQGFYVAYGSTDLGRKVSLVAPAELHHPKGYNCKGKEYDVALVKLREWIDVKTFIQLPSPSEASSLTVTGSRLQTTGWGLTEVNGWKSRELLEVEVPVVPYDSCKARYGATLPVGAICAGEAGKDACTGDSGGPLYKRRAGSQAVQVGVVSFGDSCGKAKIPGAYTPVIGHLAWIEETLKPKACTPQDIAEQRC